MSNSFWLTYQDCFVCTFILHPESRSIYATVSNISANINLDGTTNFSFSSGINYGRWVMRMREPERRNNENTNIVNIFPWLLNKAEKKY